MQILIVQKAHFGPEVVIWRNIRIFNIIAYWSKWIPFKIRTSIICIIPIRVYFLYVR